MEKNINQFISSFEEYPILFIGSGLSLRYRKQSYNWDDLLKKVSTYAYDSDDIYKLTINSIKANENSINLNLKIAQQLEKDLTQKIKNDRENFEKKYPNIYKKYIEYIENVKDKSKFISLLKFIISHLLTNEDLNEEYNDEIVLLKQASKNILSIVTTNYDNFIEKNLGFIPIIGNDVILKNPYGSVYKIHGTIENPESIIITEDDYEEFETQYDLINSILIYSFIHNPIIFLGYSIKDRNIQNLLQNIFKYVEYDSDVGKKIRNNFLIVEYNNDEDKNNLTVLPYDLNINSTTISINKIKTNRFSDIYKAISDLNLPINAMDVKKVKNILFDLEAGGTLKVHVEDSVEELDPKDRVIAIGSTKSIQYSYNPINDIIKHYLEYNESLDPNIMNKYNFDKIIYNKQRYFPILNLIETKKINITDKIMTIKENQIKKVERYKKTLEKNGEKFNEKYQSIEELRDHISGSYIYDAINYNMLNIHSIPDQEIKKFITEQIQPSLNTDKTLDSKINKMISCYDYMLYMKSLKNNTK